MQVQVNEFTGPLDLLLQLIRKEEMDIFDIDIHKITKQYLNFIEKHPVPNLDSAGDFIKLAATLIYIKSRRLFPAETSTNSESDNEPDPRQDLVESLLKIHAFQTLSHWLNEKHLLSRDVWSSQGKELELFSADFVQVQRIKKEPSIKLAKSYYQVLHRRISSPIQRQTFDSLPIISDCIRFICSRLTTGKLFRMGEFLREYRKNRWAHALVIFLSFLEMSRLGLISLQQENDSADIFVSVKKPLKNQKFQVLQQLNFLDGKEAI